MECVLGVFFLPVRFTPLTVAKCVHAFRCHFFFIGKQHTTLDHGLAQDHVLQMLCKVCRQLTVKTGSRDGKGVKLHGMPHQQQQQQQRHTRGADGGAFPFLFLSPRKKNSPI
uniref:Putative secreted peptide n=1 Tax=Anopheles braziliensis TaxID=58242 RepID=A0A2M3ZVJ8_9DIPT